MILRHLNLLWKRPLQSQQQQPYQHQQGDCSRIMATLSLFSTRTKTPPPNNNNNNNNNDQKNETKTTHKHQPQPKSQSQPQQLKYDFTSKECNIPIQIQQQIGKNLYLQTNHPLCIVQQQIAYYFNHILPSASASASASSSSILSSSSSSIRTQFEQEQKISNNTDKNYNILHDIYEKEYHPPELQSSSTSHSSSSSSSSSSSFFHVYDTISPIVSTTECFDQLLIDVFHPSRNKSDTYYINDLTVLRPHTSAHQISLIRQLILENNHQQNQNNNNNQNNGTENKNENDTATDSNNTCKYTKTAVQFLCVGDVYRRDEIDKSHYPIFHQMEGVKLFHIPHIRTYTPVQYNIVEQYIQFHLKSTLEGMIRFLFAQKNVTDIPMRWRNDSFPFTDPSYELDIYYNNEWMEILGCGMIRYEILENVNYYYNNPKDENIDTFDIKNTVRNEKHISKNILDYQTHKGWAFGIGLERLAMILFQIPDIRLFWSDDVRFHDQFRSGDIRTIPNFQPYSKYPPCIKDISFWISNYDQYHVNDTYEIIRNIGGDLIERVELIDTFTRLNKKNILLTKVSHCYRITYRSMDRSLTNAEIDTIQEEIRRQVVQQLKVELR